MNTDPDYDDDDSPKYGTEAERAAGWAAANHAAAPLPSPQPWHGQVDTETEDRLLMSAQRRVSMVSAPPVCPECRDGKCGNCDGRALNADDEIVDCQHRHRTPGR